MCKPMESKVISTESSQKKKTIFLFKSPKENEIDKFTESLEEVGLSCVIIPVLSFRFINQSILRSHLSAIHLFSAIIFTSVQAVHAVVSVAKELECEKNIYQIQSFVVGHTTADIAKRSGFHVKGENSGNAKVLAEFILQEVGEEKSKPLLYPCSNIHRDTLKELLTSCGHQLTEVICYETCPNKHMKETLQEALQKQGLPDFIVFFSPSGFQYTKAEITKELLPLDKIKIICCCLGQFTEDTLKEAFHFNSACIGVNCGIYLSRENKDS